MNYVDTSKYQHQHKNFISKLNNFISKVFLHKNLKKHNRDKEVLEHLKTKGKLGKVLVINPGEYNEFLLEYLKQNSNLLIGWNYDSMKRKPINTFHFNTFYKIYSFDRIDCLKENRLFLQTNYIIGDKIDYRTSSFKYKSYCVMAYDKFRVDILLKIFKSINHNSSFAQIKYKKYLPNVAVNHYIKWSLESIFFKEINENLFHTEIFIDILRNDKYNQVGLSFRVLDAMRFQRKLITTNKDIVNYDFYNPNNIFVVEDLNNIKISRSFIDNIYEPISDEIYNKYTLKSFCETVLELEF